ncbi:hypothetical protein G7Y41_01530 [Schaalia sp. ZJ405]|uniref:hypothetical protein n=1 Tax=Schaalia sp. ZJ405 TaxID=2709403 RepID=UPI0013EA94DE|nr:hypothetical protein [Schaalia sp. ZJ405]QPK81563.1 hypothetical protein G7Y41_01530 [Schaalia sp. ZJ405]
MSDLGGYLTYIGKSLYAADVTWNGAIDDLEIYKGAQALTLASAVTISGASTVIVGDSTQLSASVTPADALDSSLTWTSPTRRQYRLIMEHLTSWRQQLFM